MHKQGGKVMVFIENLTSELSELFPGLIITSIFIFIPAIIILTGMFLSNKITNSKKISLAVKITTVILALVPPIYLIISGFLSDDGLVALFFIPIIIVITLISIVPVLLPILFAVMIKKQNKSSVGVPSIRKLPQGGSCSKT